MDAVLRAAAIYLFLLVIFRLAGRSLEQVKIAVLERSGGISVIPR